MNPASLRRALRAGALVLLLSGASAPGSAADLVVGSKNFAESRLLGELFAQLIEARTTLRVERRLGLAGTQFAFDALRRGAIDLYPEYTGTGWVTILGEPPEPDAARTLVGVRRAFRERFDLLWLAPLGFENSYELAVPEDLARERQLRSISDLAAVSEELRAGLGYEFVERDDGLPGLRRTYGLEFRSVVTMLQAPKYQAAATGNIDVLDVYTTDGRLLTHDLRVLEDDRGFFPPYEAAPLARAEAVRRFPEAFAALSLLAGALPDRRMRALNLRLQENKDDVAEVAVDALASLGLLDPTSLHSAREEERPPGTATASLDVEIESFWSYLAGQRDYVLRLTLQHLGLCGIALGLGVLVALPLALWLQARPPRVAESAIRVVGTSQTIPSLALLGVLIPLLGIGTVPAVVALWLYSIFPILRGAYSGLRDADPAAASAALALGMEPGQVLRWVRLPLAAPAIMAGVRTAAVITIGTATVAAFIGAGGLGEPIIAGVQLVDGRRILLGAIPAALLALAVDFLLGRVEAWIRPAGAR